MSINDSATQQLVLKLYQEKVPIERIAKHIKKAKSCIRKVLNDNGIFPSQDRSAAYDKFRKKVADLKQSGKTIKQIAKFLNKSEASINEALKKSNLTKTIRFTTERKEKIVEFYKNGNNIQYILEDFKITEFTLKRILKEYGIKYESKPKPKEKLKITENKSKKLKCAVLYIDENNKMKVLMSKYEKTDIVPRPILKIIALYNLFKNDSYFNSIIDEEVDDFIIRYKKPKKNIEDELLLDYRDQIPLDQQFDKEFLQG